MVLVAIFDNPIGTGVAAQDGSMKDGIDII